MSTDTTGPEPLTSLRNYRLLGRSGLRVSPLCYGTMNIADKDMADFETSRKLIESYMEQGGNFFDTANVYGGGESEKHLGQVLAQHRSKAVIATKFTGSTSPGDPNAGGNSRKSLVQSLDESLKRLGVGYVDILYLHFWEYRTPVDEVMRALDDVVRSGKVLYLGASDIVAWKMAQANTIADFRGWTPFVALQTQYSLIERTAERDLLPMAFEFDIGCVPWGPLAQGMLSGKYNHLTVEDAKNQMGAIESVASRADQRKAVGIDSYRPKAVLSEWTQKNRDIALKVADVAKDCDKSSVQVAFNWNLQKPGVTSPIFGIRTQAQLDEVIQSLSFRLTSQQMRELDTVSSIDLGFPQRWGAADNFLIKGNIAGIEQRRTHFNNKI